MVQIGNNGKPWSKQEQETLLDYMRNSDLGIRDIAEAMERSPMAILLRARLLVGIDTRTKEEAGSAAFDGRKWDAIEDRYLVEQFLKGSSLTSLAKHFDRTDTAIVKRLYKVLTDERDLGGTFQRIRKLRKLEPGVAKTEPVEVVDPFRPGYYRHFKGNFYYLVEVATHSESLEPMVVYRALYGERKLWVRPASMWTEVVDKPEYHGPRFVAVDEKDVPEESRL